MKKKHPGSRRSFRITRIESPVMKWDKGGYYLATPRKGWVGEEVQIDLGGKLEKFTVSSGKTGPVYVADRRLEPFLGQWLEVILKKQTAK